MDKSRVMVSVICNVYNHAPFLEKTLRGFVIQETNFKYEVIVHDDASTDDSASIIRRYAEMYPDVFVPIFEHKNQYSKGVSITKCIDLPKANGRYVAFCEGDDYWIDPLKLQHQFDYLESHDDYALCLHNAYVADAYLDCVYLSESDSMDKDKDMRDVILEGGGKINPTASMFFRNELPDDWPSGPVGDHFFLIMLASMGKVRWLSAPMSVYRYRTGQSWTFKNNCGSRKLASGYYEKYKRTLDEWNKLTEYKWRDTFDERIALMEESRRRDLLLYGKRLGISIIQKPSLKGRAIVFMKKFLPDNIARYVRATAAVAALRKSGAYVTPLSLFESWLERNTLISEYGDNA